MGSPLANQKILVTGVTSQVGLPVARALCDRNEVHGLARLRKAEDRDALAALGVVGHAIDLSVDPLDSLPTDFDYVLNFAVVKSGNWERDLAANAEGTGRLMSHCRGVRAFLHCSSTAVYAEGAGEPVDEHAPLGDNHRSMLPTYSICKIAAETMARFAAREWQIPTTVARLSVPYGDNGGWPWYHLLMMKSDLPIPVHPEPPHGFNPIHEDDTLEQLPRLLEIADVPATVLNWGGSEQASIEDWCGHIALLTGLAPKFQSTRDTIRGLPVDVGRMHELVGRTRIDWRDGIRRMIAARAPELLI